MLFVDWQWQLQKKITYFKIIISIIILNVLNIIDGLFTLYWIYKYQAIELNPIMNYLINIDESVFIIVKILLILGSSLVFLKFRNKSFITGCIVFSLLIYFVVCCYHLYWWFLL